MAEVNMIMRSSSNMAHSFLIFTCLLVTCCNSQVPFVMWTSEGYSLTSVSPPVVGQMMSVGQVNSYLTSALTTAPHTVLLFLQDKLSLEDFTVYGGVFGDHEDSAFPNLQAFLQAAPTPLVLPSIALDAAAEVPALLQEALGTAPLYTDPNSLAQQTLPYDPALLVIGLPYTSGTKTKETLHQNDEIIGKVVQTMQARNVPYTAIYTGLKPSRVPEMSSVPSAGLLNGRHLLQTPPAAVKAPVMFNSSGTPCILMWAETLEVSFQRNSQWVTVDLEPSTFTPSLALDGSFCNGTNAVLVLNYNNVLNFTRLSLSFVMAQRRFPVSGRNWTLLEQVRLVYDSQSATFNGSRGIYSPVEYSFHCQMVSSTRDPLLVPSNPDDNAKFWRIHFSDFQIQGFNVSSVDFSYASDCAGFFTPGIWMGLLTTLLMLLILTYGLHMLTQLRTMDRFQDPKGPSISVPLNE